jgi:hypothetical protein
MIMHTRLFEVTVTLDTDNVFTLEFDDYGNAAEYANSIRERGGKAIVRIKL